MQSLTVLGRVNSRYTSVRRLGNSRLSEALISENDMIENMKYLQQPAQVTLKSRACVPWLKCCSTA
jgi:hypothetical protein